MGAIITKQPNGKYARFSYVVDTFTDWNLTKDELKELMTRKFGVEDYDVIHFEDFLAGKHSYRPEDFYNYQRWDFVEQKIGNLLFAGMMIVKNKQNG